MGSTLMLDYEALGTEATKLQTEGDNMSDCIDKISRIVNGLPDIWQAETGRRYEQQYGELDPSLIEEEDEEQPEPDTEIIFGVDAAVNKTAAKSALADMHGVFVFRDAFITQERLVKQAEKDEREQIEKKVLTTTQPEASYKELAELVFQADTYRYNKDVYYEKESSDLFCGFIAEL